MEAGRHESRQGLIVGESLQPLASPSTLTLRVPARPEALGVVRLILMSCGAAAGVPLEELFKRSQEVAEAFATILVEKPETTSVVVVAQAGASDVGLIPVRGDRSEI